MPPSRTTPRTAFSAAPLGLAKAAPALRGASVLTQAAGGLPPAPAAASRPPVSARERKALKKAETLIREATKAMEIRAFRHAEDLCAQAIALCETPTPVLWIHRLVAAAKASNFDFVANNYQRIRQLAQSEEQKALVEQTWIDCLLAAGLLREALAAALPWANRKTRAQPAICSTIGVIQAALGDYRAAIATQTALLAENPDNHLARWHLAMHQLEAGVLPDAFENYEARWSLAEFPSERRRFALPRWQGEPIAGKRVLVWREQGIGDEIRFAGILPDLVSAGAEVTLECSPKLAALFSASFPEIRVRPVKPAAARRPEDEAGFDFEVPIGSLARFFRPTVADMQARCRPWLKRDATVEAEVRASMQAGPRQPVIGLCWRSSQQNLKRNQHYLRPEHLAALRLLGASAFISLQYDESQAELALLRELGLPVTEFPGIDQMNDLVGAAQLAGACDIVISAGTAVAELSAGLGIPTVLFGVNHSQIQLGTDGVPWHPATRFIPVDAQDPMAVVKAILFNWPDLASWARSRSISGREIDWQLSFPASA